MPRLFIGLELPDEAKTALALLRGGIEGARWQSDDQYHLTLRFIGEVPPPILPEIAAALGRLEGAGFELGLRGVGIFGEPERPRLLWAGVADPEPLIRLHRRIDRLLAAIGIPSDMRKYIPHVTLARFSGRAGRVAPWLLAHDGFRFPPFMVGEAVLFESHLGHAAARYEPLLRVPLNRSS
ncbi:MAG: RNA 2',3'-cyclic phosphodiesterase [Rhodothalassiaceae bacterium]